MPKFKVSTFHDGLLVGERDVVADSPDAAAKAVCGPNLQESGEAWEVVALVEDENRRLQQYYYRSLCHR
jgi:hypothetical protein